MKFSCPKCQARLNLPVERVPVSGAWAKCPRCAERFFIPALDKTLNLTATPQARASSFSAGVKSSERQELLSRLKKKNGTAIGEEPPIDLNEITVYPEYSESPMLRKVVTGVLLVIPLVFVIVAFLSATPVTSPDQVSSIAQEKISVFKPQESIAYIKKEIMSMRRRLMFRGEFKFDIDSSGVETRVFNYFMNKIIPDICKNISHLEMSSMDSQYGFKAVGSCIDKGSPAKVEMEVQWSGNIAIITFPKLSGNMYEIQLFQ